MIDLDQSFKPPVGISCSINSYLYPSYQYYVFNINKLQEGIKLDSPSTETKDNHSTLELLEYCCQ